MRNVLIYRQYLDLDFKPINRLRSDERLKNLFMVCRESKYRMSPFPPDKIIFKPPKIAEARRSGLNLAEIKRACKFLYDRGKLEKERYDRKSQDKFQDHSSALFIMCYYTWRQADDGIDILVIHAMRKTKS